MRNCGVLIMLAACVCAATTYDVEMIPGVETRGKHIVVDRLITIPAGDTLSLHKGQRIYFAEMAGIDVLGTLVTDGDEEQPLLLASIKDTAQAGSAFDWQGVRVKEGGRVDISFTKIMSAVFGLTVEKGGSVSVLSCKFTNCGQWAVSMEGTVINVPEGQLFSFAPRSAKIGENASESALEKEEATEKQISGATPPAKGDTKGKTRKVILRVGLGVAGVGFSAASAYLFDLRAQSQTKYDAYVPGNTQFDKASASGRQAKYSSLKRQYKNAGVQGAAAAVAAGLSLVGLGITFVF